ncbi:hypothetical protein BDZ45DRAFT_28024 [Acephala macrosclerotiorum]|nr:hypothetical protein BDZ45DRAFT_28024 [Acephala macrosclerotiorum]
MNEGSHSKIARDPDRFSFRSVRYLFPPHPQFKEQKPIASTIGHHPTRSDSVSTIHCNHQMPSTPLKRTTTLIICAIFATSLHLLFQLATLSLSLSALLNLSATFVITYVWVKVYLLVTGENGINPFVNVGITLGSPFLAKVLRDGAVRRGEWEVTRR